MRSHVSSDSRSHVGAEARRRGARHDEAAPAVSRAGARGASAVRCVRCCFRGKRQSDVAVSRTLFGLIFGTSIAELDERALRRDRQEVRRRRESTKQLCLFSRVTDTSRPLGFFFPRASARSTCRSCRGPLRAPNRRLASCTAAESCWDTGKASAALLPAASARWRAAHVSFHHGRQADAAGGNRRALEEGARAHLYRVAVASGEHGAE